MNLREQICFSIAAMEPTGLKLDAIDTASGFYLRGFEDAKAEALRRAESVTLDEQFANPERMSSCSATTLSYDEMDGVPELPRLDAQPTQPSQPVRADFGCACIISNFGGHPWTDASKCPIHKAEAESANARY